jgi:hypothetical protein
MKLELNIPTDKVYVLGQLEPVEIWTKRMQKSIADFLVKMDFISTLRYLNILSGGF